MFQEGSTFPTRVRPICLPRLRPCGVTKAEVEGTLASGRVLLRWTENGHLEQVEMEPSIGSLVSVGEGGEEEF